tara:strand:+ start:19531 stop:20412 length:882 start_codon:yes stop_codon:yes gene_type:complete
MKYNKSSISNTTIEYAFRHILLQELKSINQWRKVAIKAKDPEGVHQIRISLRRIRTALQVFKPIINTKFSQTLTKKLKTCATVLDDARDLDVYILMHFADDTESTIKSAVISKRNKAYLRVKKLLKSKQFNKLIRSSKKWVKTGQWQKRVLRDKKLNNSLKSFAFDTLGAMTNVIIIKGLHPEQLDDLALHKLRIDCKKLRYTTEFFISLYDETMIKAFIDKLKQLQDSLGDIHDCFIQKKLHLRLLQKNKKMHLTLVSQQVLLQIDRTAESKKSQLCKELTTFCHSESPWQA